MFKRLTRYVLFTGLIIFLFNCGPRPGTKKIDPTVLWNKDQAAIEPGAGTENTWSGFKIEKGFFVPAKGKPIAKFILWRKKQEKKELTIRYLLRGMSVNVLINGKKAFRLKPRYKLGPFKKQVTLSGGFNFIEFRKRGKCRLKIKSLTFGSLPGEEAYHLGQNETVTRFHSRGSGEISLSGKGKLYVRKVEFPGGKKHVTEKELEPGFLSRTVTYPFQFQTPGFLQVSAAAGNFNIINYSFINKRKSAKTLSRQWEKTTKEKPHIFILLIDGCHVSHLGVYGYHRDTSPNIDRFAKDGVIFDNAYANATFTRSSVATLFTGFFPHRHKLRIMTNRLPKDLFMLPEFLKKKGYKTSILTEAGNISKFFGFAQGVDHYRKIFRKWNDPRYLENNIFIYFNQWIKNPGPLFTYVHFRAPHFPIIPPPPFLDMYKKKKTGINRDRLIFHLKSLGEKGYRFTPEEIRDVIDDYDSSIRYVDEGVGKLLDALKTKGIYDSSFIIFTSDHGEALYEHGYWGHGQNVYPETSAVPLIVKFPSGMGLTGRIQRVTQLADIFPTFAALFGEKRYFDGQSLLESIKIKKQDDTFAFSITFGDPPSIGIRWRDWYYIIHLHSNNREELFHLKSDPLKDVSPLKENKDTLTFFRAKFLNWLIQFDNLERASRSVDLKKLPKDVYDNLKSLGYID